MPAMPLARFLNPWKYRREERRRQVDKLRERDGECCRRCRRPIRFDLGEGHDLGVRIEEIAPALDGGARPEGLANLCLTHGRCNAGGQDHTGEVTARLRPKREADLFAKARDKRRAA